MDKKPFDLDIALRKIESMIEDFPKAAMFELAENGFNSIFEQLLGCIISVRTKDEITLKVSKKLFEKARTPQDILKLDVAVINETIKQSTFHEQKSYRMLEIAKIVIEKYDGSLPCSQDVLLSLPGIGPKCANLVLGVACNQPFISVDIHVHRVTNRWGYISQSSPEKSLKELEQKVPQKYWININRLIMPFGKFICTGTTPNCSKCTILDMCEQIGVKEST